MKPTRCPWAGDEQIYIDYHDKEWGRPIYDGRRLFELLSLEAMQAGLSWLTVLKKRENFRRAFQDFCPETLAGYGEKDIERLLQDTGIIRNRRKIEAVIANARAYLALEEKEGSFADYLWSFTDGRQLVHSCSDISEVPAHSSLSDKISRDLKKRGFVFVGPTIIYAFMQSCGMVWDHLTTCFVYDDYKLYER